MLLVLCFCESKETAIEQPVETAEGTEGKGRQRDSCLTVMPVLVCQQQKGLQQCILRWT